MKTTTAGRTFAYVRVSTKEQNTDRQIDELSKYVEDSNNIIIDKASGKDFNRPNYKALRQLSNTGDTIYIKSLDRLGRNKQAIKEELEYFKDKGVIIRCLNIPTTLMDLSQFGEMQKAIFDMVNNILIEVLGTMAEQERKTTKQRQKEGIQSAKARGKQLGRPKATFPENWKNVYDMWTAGTITAKTAMETMNMKRTTFYKLVNVYQNQQKLQQQQ
jgi:DNA invertase Pin-like site-specific DNA recombinase